MVVANIIARVIAQLAVSLVAATRPGGTLIASGIIADRRHEAEEPLSQRRPDRHRLAHRRRLGHARGKEGQLMPAGRFYVGDLALAPGMELELPPDVAHRARDVLRLAPGQSLSLLDGKGGVYSAQLLAVSRHHLTVRLGERRVEEEASSTGRALSGYAQGSQV